MQLQGSNKLVESRLKELLNELNGFKLYAIMKILLKKNPQGDNTLYKSAYFNSKPQIIMNDTNIDATLGLISQQLLKKIGQWLSEGSGWMIESVDKYYLNL